MLAVQKLAPIRGPQRIPMRWGGIRSGLHASTIPYPIYGLVLPRPDALTHWTRGNRLLGEPFPPAPDSARHTPGQPKDGPSQGHRRRNDSAIGDRFARSARCSTGRNVRAPAAKEHPRSLRGRARRRGARGSSSDTIPEASPPNQSDSAGAAPGTWSDPGHRKRFLAGQPRAG